MPWNTQTVEKLYFLGWPGSANMMMVGQTKTNICGLHSWRPDLIAQSPETTPFTLTRFNRSVSWSKAITVKAPSKTGKTEIFLKYFCFYFKRCFILKLVQFLLKYAPDSFERFWHCLVFLKKWAKQKQTCGLHSWRPDLITQSPETKVRFFHQCSDQ